MSLINNRGKSKNMANDIQNIKEMIFLEQRGG